MGMKEFIAGGLVSIALTGCKMEYTGIEGYSCTREMSVITKGFSPTIYKLMQGSKTAELEIYGDGSWKINYNEKLWSKRDDVLEALDACVESFKTFDNRKMKK